MIVIKSILETIANLNEIGAEHEYGGETKAVLMRIFESGNKKFLFG